MEVDFVHGTLVLLVNLLLHCFAGFGEVPDANMAIGGRSCQVIICGKTRSK